MSKHVSSGHRIGVRRPRSPKPVPVLYTEPWTGWVYSACNLYGHPAKEHWHPPVSQTPPPGTFRDTDHG